MTDANIEQLFEALDDGTAAVSIRRFGDAYSVRENARRIGHGETVKAALEDACRGGRDA